MKPARTAAQRIPILNSRMLVAVGAVAVLLLSAMVQDSVASQVVILNPWSAASGGAARSSYDPEPAPAAVPLWSWIFDRTDQNGVISGGNVYVIGYDRSYPAWLQSDTSQIPRSAYALDARTGDIVWERLLYAGGDAVLTRTQDGSKQINSQPTVAGGKVVFWDHKANVWALDAATGSLAWKVDTGEEIFAYHHKVSPLVVGDRVYLLVDTGAAAGIQTMKLKALNLADGTEAFAAATSAYSQDNLASDGTRIVASYGDALYAFSTQDGSLLWSTNVASGFSLPFSNALLSAPAVANGIAFVHVGPISGVGSGGVAAVRMSDGFLWWSKTLQGSSNFGAPVAADASLVAVAQGTTLSGLDPATGTIRWAVGPFTTFGAPTLTSDSVLVIQKGDYGGQLASYRRDDGAGSYYVFGGRVNLGAPQSLAAGNGILVGSIEYYDTPDLRYGFPGRALFAFGPDVLAPKWRSSPAAWLEPSDAYYTYLRWSEVDELNWNRFDIQMADSPYGPWNYAGSQGYNAPDPSGAQRSIRQEVPPPGVTRYYRVQHVDAVGQTSPYSNVVELRGPSGGPTPTPSPAPTSTSSAPPSSSPVQTGSTPTATPQPSPSPQPTASPQPYPYPVAADSVVVTPVHLLEFGQAQRAVDDCVYAELQEAGASAMAPTPYDLRLVPCLGHPQFTFVKSGDGRETGYPQGAGNQGVPVRLTWADINSNGRYDQGDMIYLGTGGPNALQASTTPDSFAIRLTGGMGYPAGSWVSPGETDIVAYGNTVQPMEGSFAWVDHDGSGSLSDADAAYFLPDRPSGYPAGYPLQADAIPLRDPGAPHTNAPPPTASGGPTTVPAPPPTGSTDRRFQVDPTSLAFDSTRVDPGTIVTIFARALNPTTSHASGRAVFEAYDDAGERVFVTRVPVSLAPGETRLLKTNWLPEREGSHQLYAYLEASANTTQSPDEIRTGQANAASARLYVGPLPSNAPILLLTAGLINIGTIEEGTARTVPLEVTAYNIQASNVRLDVMDNDGLVVQTLTPPTTLQPGSTVKFFIQIRVPELEGNASVGARTILVRAVSDELTTNVEALDLIVHEQPPRSLPAFGAGAAAAGLAAAGGIAVFFRRRH